MLSPTKRSKLVTILYETDRCFISITKANQHSGCQVDSQADRRTDGEADRQTEKVHGSQTSPNFIPLLVFEHFGHWGSASDYLNSLIKRSQDFEGCQNEAEFCGYWRKTFSVLLQRSNVRFILCKLSCLLPTEDHENLLDRAIQSSVH